MSRALQPPKDAILLGGGKWIEHVDLTGRYDSAVDIDPWIKDLEPMWSALETECVADCCGIDAFDFCPENLATVEQKLERTVVCHRLKGLRSQLEALPGDVFVSRRLNNYSARSVFFALLDHLQDNFCGGSLDG